MSNPDQPSATTTPAQPPAQGRGGSAGRGRGRGRGGSAPPEEGAKRQTALDPRKPTVVQPWASLVQNGLIELRVAFTATSLSTEVTILCSEEREVLGPQAALARLRDLGRIDQHNKLIVASRSNNAGAAQQGLPKKSLDRRDFGDNSTVGAVEARARSVANALTVNTIRGRILSLFRPSEDVITIEQFWARAEPTQRLRVLMDSSKLSELEGVEDDFERAKAHIRQTGSPFRGALRPQTAGTAPPPTYEEEA